MDIIIKTKEQIDGIRRSSKLAALSLKYIEPFVVAGVTTEELDWRLEEFMRSHGAIPACLGYKVQGIDVPFPKATCISVNDVICHGVPNSQKLQEGDILNIDVTTILDGYYGDTSTMFTVGKISKDAEHLINVAKRCLGIGINQVRPGNRFGNIGYLISNYAWVNGCTVVTQFQGHGVGLAFHEEPVIPFVAEKNSGPEMLPGMIFTIEPMINLGDPDAVLDKQDHWTARTVDGGLSAQFEHTVLCTPNGHEILTKGD